MTCKSLKCPEYYWMSLRGDKPAPQYRIKDLTMTSFKAQSELFCRPVFAELRALHTLASESVLEFINRTSEVANAMDRR